MLTWWEGQLLVGDGDGVGHVYDTSYKSVATITAGNGYSIDLHELTITPQNTAVVLSYERFKRDLRPWGGPRDARIVDNIVQEVDLRTDPVLFEWHTFGNVEPNESNVPPPTAPGFEWEYFHVNSAEIPPDGNFLISARNTSTIYKIDRPTGKIIWRLGGKNSDLQARPGRALRLAAQRPLAGRRHPQHLRQLGRSAHAQELARAHPPPRRAGQDGHARERLQAPARVALGQPGQRRDAAERQPVRRLGVAALLHRVRREGNVIFDGRLARGNDNYRAFRFPWVGCPSTPRRSSPPPEAARSPLGELERRDPSRPWELLGGAAASALAPIGSAAYGGLRNPSR